MILWEAGINPHAQEACLSSCFHTPQKLLEIHVCVAPLQTLLVVLLFHHPLFIQGKLTEPPALLQLDPECMIKQPKIQKKKM